MRARANAATVTTTLAAAIALFAAACAGASHVGSASGGPRVDSLLRQALQPAGDQRIHVVAESDAAAFPEVVFYRATRVPPFGQGMEDTRPPVAAALRKGDTVLVVTRIEEVPAAWAIARPPTIADTSEALSRIPRLLLLTGMANDAQLVRSPEQARRAVQMSTVDHPEVLDSVRSPQVRTVAGRRELRVYLDRPGGVFEYVFSTAADASLRVDVRRLSRRLLGP